MDLLLSALHADFPAGPPPEIDDSSGSEVLRVATERTAGQTWPTARPEVLDAVHDALPLLEPQVFVYWLPGLLGDLLRDPRRSGWYGECLLLALTPHDRADLLRLLGALAGAHPSAAAAVTRYEQEERADRVEARWDQMNPAQERDVLGVLDYLMRVHASRSAATAAARRRAQRLVPAP